MFYKGSRAARLHGVGTPLMMGTTTLPANRDFRFMKLWNVALCLLGFLSPNSQLMTSSLILVQAKERGGPFVGGWPAMTSAGQDPAFLPQEQLLGPEATHWGRGELPTWASPTCVNTGKYQPPCA